MHFDDIMNIILENFPTAQMEEDSEGYLIVHTGLKSDGVDHWWPIKETEDEN